MKSPKRTALAYVAEYQFGDDNLLTATFHEEQRLRDEARVRNVQPAIRLRDISLSDDDPFINNAKRLQQDQDRREVIAQHNMLLLERLEKIHQHHVPKQFDVSHLSDEVLNAPRASNASLRRRQQQQIATENEKLQTRLSQARGSLLSNKKLALDADKHRYLGEQISKVARRRKVRERCQALQLDQRQLQLQQQQHAVRECGYEDREEHGHGMLTKSHLSGSKSLSRLDQTKKPSGFGAHGKLPQIHARPSDSHRHQQQCDDDCDTKTTPTKKKTTTERLPAAHATLANTTKLISALDLPFPK